MCTEITSATLLKSVDFSRGTTYTNPWLLSPVVMVEFLPNRFEFLAQRSAARRERVEGFTLIELLVTVAIIGILASLLLPSLTKAHGRGQQVYCMNNLRQLALAWAIYAQDHNDRLAYNLGATEISQMLDRNEHYNWANSIMNWETNASNTNVLLNIDASLGIYLSRNGAIYRCPSDHVLSPVQRRAQWENRSRTYSMNAMVGDAGEFTTGGKNVNNPYYRQFWTLNEIPSASMIFVFIEEHPDSINDGYFVNKAYSGEWTDLPASYHSGGANLSFADGHVESHRWLRSSTKYASAPDVVRLPFKLEADDRADLSWVLAHMSVK